MRYDFDGVAQALLERPRGLVFLLGAPDTGKTTLFKRIAGSFVRAGAHIGLVDADVGQSSIGPPTTVGMALVAGALPDFLAPQVLHFVGNNSPVGHLLDVVVGSKRMVERATQAGAETVLFDSSGLVQPPYGSALKYHKLELLRPRYVVAIEKSDELGHLMPWLACRGAEVLRARAPVQVRSMSAQQRARYRQERYRRYFAGAPVASYAIHELCLYPPGFLNGATDLTGLLVGLQDERWNTVAVGSIESYDEDEVRIVAPLNDGVAVHGLLAGRIKLSREGVEFERLRSRQLL